MDLTKSAAGIEYKMREAFRFAAHPSATPEQVALYLSWAIGWASR